MPLVTIAVPAYNSGKTVGRMIDSVLAQGYTNWELLIADDGSQDNTADVVRSYRDPRIRLISDRANRKIAFRLNQLIDEARGEIFLRMDADDKMFPNRIERQVRFLLENPDVDIVGGGAIVTDDDGTILGGRSLVAVPVEVSWLMHPTVAGRTAWFRKNRYDERFSGCEDTELWNRTKKFSKLVLLNGPVIYYKDSSTFNLRQYIRRKFQGMHVALCDENLSPRVRIRLFISASIKMVCSLGVCALGQSKFFVRRRNTRIEDLPPFL